MNEDKRIKRIEELVVEKGVSFAFDLELFRKKKPEKEIIDFFCLCGSRECIPHRESNGISGPGGRSRTAYYKCAGCTIHFDNPKKYSEAQRKIKELYSNTKLTKSIVV